MGNCALLGGCLFFNDKMAAAPGTAGMYKKRYCIGDNSKCARYVIATTLGRDKVPADLYPNQAERVKKIISGKK
ncbi:MAG: hypothetical protein KJ915_04200 [Candidatus Omnitrophica bacterium]|nr:hypothetical protein [Candidatus Omnitrophota bacterium]